MSGVVAWSETDASGNFHFTAPQCWAENVEHAILRDAGVDPATFPRRAVNAAYTRSLRAGDEYKVDFGVERIGTTSITYWWRVICQDIVCADGSYTTVHVDSAARPKPVPAALRTALAPHVRTPAA